MKKTTVSLLALLLISSSTFSQTYVSMVKEPEGKEWGYINLKGEIIIAPQFKKAFQFSSDGIAVVLTKKDYYFVNLKGEKIPTVIDDFKLLDMGNFGFDIEGYYDGLVAIQIDKNWGYLDKKGQLAIPAKYDKVTVFNSGYAIVTKDKKFSIINQKGEEKLIDNASVVDVKKFSESMAPYKDANNEWGFIDVTGKTIVPAHYKAVGYFYGGHAWVKDANGKLGYINKKGEEVIKLQFKEGQEFNAESGLARIKTATDEWAYVNLKNEILYQKDTEAFGDFSNGLCKGKKSGKWGFYNTKMEWVIQPQFDGAREFKNGYTAAKLNEKWGIIDTQGKWVIQPKFDAIKDMELMK